MTLGRSLKSKWSVCSPVPQEWILKGHCQAKVAICSCPAELCSQKYLAKNPLQGQLLLLLSLKLPFSSLPFPGAGNSSENSRILVTFFSPKMGWWLIFLAFKIFMCMGVFTCIYICITCVYSSISLKYMVSINLITCTQTKTARRH